MACMKARETFLIDCAWSIRQTGLILAKRAAIIMSVWLTLDNVTERSSALRVHSARRPLLLRQSKLGEILQTSDTQSLFVNCSKEGFSALQQKWFFRDLWVPLVQTRGRIFVHLAVLLVHGVSSLVKTSDGCSSAELTVNSTCMQPLVLGTWYFCRTYSGKYLYATLGGSLARGICPASASRQFHGQSEESARAALIFHNLSQPAWIMWGSRIPLLWHKTL